ncbi:MAG: glycosyltransferase [Bacteroidetes bacterium]|nr:glycosyltransferase [Bacteroidota bacterium]
MLALTEIILWLFAIVFLFEGFRILGGLKKAANSGSTKVESEKVDGISLVIPVRNEHSNLLSLIDNLNELERPECGFEVIFVDDHSDDETLQVLFQFKQDYEWVKVVSLKNDSGKPSAIDAGIKSATFSVIATTDADMKLNSEWIRFLNKTFSTNSKISMACGPTLSTEDGFMGEGQVTDWMYMMAVASGSLHSGFPLSAIGNNMAFRIKDYNDLGGYRLLPFSITEDFALFRLFLSAGKQVVFPSTHENLHLTQPNRSWKEFVSQRKRWILGGVKSPVRSWVLVASGIGLHFSILFGWLLNPWLCLAAILIKLATDYLLINQFCNQTGTSFNRKGFFQFEIVYPFINLSIPIITLFSRKVTWKGREYHETHSR